MRIFWQGRNPLYNSTVRHLHQNGNYTVIYDDLENERLGFDNYLYKIESEHKYSAVDAVLNANSAVTEHCFSKNVDKRI